MCVARRGLGCRCCQGITTRRGGALDLEALSGERRSLWGSATKGKGRAPKRGAAQGLTTQQETAKPSAGQGPPKAPRRQAGKATRENHNRQAKPGGKGGGGPRAGAKPTKAGGGGRIGRQPGGTRRRGERHKPGARATRSGGTHQGHRPSRESGRDRGRRDTENQSARHSSAHERIRTTRTANRNRPASGDNRSGNTGDQGPKGPRKPAAARKGDNRRGH
jgi:hypothetical protein